MGRQGLRSPYPKVGHYLFVNPFPETEVEMLLTDLLHIRRGVVRAWLFHMVFNAFLCLRLVYYDVLWLLWFCNFDGALSCVVMNSDELPIGGSSIPIFSQVVMSYTRKRPSHFHSSMISWAPGTSAKTLVSKSISHIWYCLSSHSHYGIISNATLRTWLTQVKQINFGSTHIELCSIT